MTAQPNTLFRLTTLLFALLLGARCIWLLLPALSRPGIDRLPTDAAAAAMAAAHRRSAAWAAAIGAIRGDLWAQSAFAYADLLWADAGANANPTEVLERARASLHHALSEAPHSSGAWLLLAGLASRYPSRDQNATEALKMSYYTGPSEPDLIPLRLRIALKSDFVNDPEIQLFVKRDLRMLLARQRNPAIAEAYNAASPAGKHFIEEAVGEIDPSALQSLRAGARGPIAD